MTADEVEALYRLYGYALHRRCSRVLRTPVAADDALQEVFVRVLRYGASFDHREPLAWLYRIADNVCFDRLKRERREAPTEPGQEDALVQVPSGEPQPDARQLLLELLACSGPKEQSAAALHYLDGLNHGEIATRLGCSREAVTQRLARFHEAVRKLFRKDARNEDRHDVVR